MCVAVSTVVRAAHAYLAGGVEGLYDKRLRNGRTKADGPFRARVTAADQLLPTLNAALDDDGVSLIACPVDYSENLRLTDTLGQLDETL